MVTLQHMQAAASLRTFAAKLAVMPGAKILSWWPEFLEQVSLAMHDSVRLQVAMFLGADPQPWASVLCDALLTGHASLPAALRLLQSLSANEQWALLRFHPHLQRPSIAGLEGTLAALPPALHSHAVEAQATAKVPQPCKFQEAASFHCSMLASFPPLCAVPAGPAAGLSITVAAASIEDVCTQDIEGSGRAPGLPAAGLPALLAACQGAPAELAWVHLTLQSAPAERGLLAHPRRLMNWRRYKAVQDTFDAAVDALAALQLQRLMLHGECKFMCPPATHSMAALLLLQLDRFSGLITLALDNMELGAVHLQHLAGMTALQHLALAECRLQCVAQLTLALQAGNKLQTFSLRHSIYIVTSWRSNHICCPVCNADCLMQMLAALPTQTALQELDMWHFAAVDRVSCEYGPIPPLPRQHLANVWAALCAATGLQRLSLPDRTVLFCTNSMPAALSSITMLEVGALSDGTNSDEGSEAQDPLARLLRHMPRLQALHAEADLGVESGLPAERVAACTQLRCLSMRMMMEEHEAPSSTKMLPSTLTALELTGMVDTLTPECRLQLHQLVDSAKACTGLRSLALTIHLTDDDDIEAPVATSLLSSLSLCNLTGLRLRGAVFGLELVAKLIAGMPALVSLTVIDFLHGTQPEWAAFGSALSALPELQALSLRGLHVRDGGALASQIAAAGLQRVQQLEVLFAWRDEVVQASSQDCTYALRQLVQQCVRMRNLSCLKLDADRLPAIAGDRALIAQGDASGLLQALRECPCLHSVSLRGMLGFVDEAGRAQLRRALAADVELHV